ncbi:MFS transporter [Arcicella sp. DC2W]|uniref:MFS transporter n=1 Tax=Arcicella gelida TaxID=2984195 RepID=A0ABU5SB05_9BACT|nr:MFS transporter [Arcicella sp. DC2W]MEA5405393.1 MFS transporter [Arcicella sp. DC2W]
MFAKSLQLYRNAYLGLPKSVWLLSGVMFVNRSGTMVLPFLSLYLTQKLHFSVTDAGIVMGVYGTGALFGTFLGGKLTDKVGFYYIQFFSLLFAGMMLLVIMHLTNFYAICTGVFIFTLLGDCFRPANAAALAYYSEVENRTRSFSLNRLAINLGWSIGGGMGGILAEINYDLLFWADGITCIVAAILLRVLLKVPVQKSKNEAETLLAKPLIRSPYQDKVYWFFMVCVTLYAISFFQLFSLEPLYFRTVYHLPESQIGLLMVCNGLMIAFIEMILVHQLDGKFLKTNLIAIGTALTALSFWVFNTYFFVGILWISIILNTVGEMFAMPFMQSFSIERSDESNRGQYIAMYTMCYSFAQITSPTIGSQVVDNFGFTTLWYVMGCFCLLSTVGFLYLKTLK